MKSAAILADILRVDHAGETGAIYIYRAQGWVAGWRCPALRTQLAELCADETRHRDIFQAAMEERGIRPCAMLPLWWSGGALLGVVTALFGARAIHICTEAVERTVHRHMDDQVAWLDPIDQAMAACIAAIRDEELDHLDAALRGRGAGRSPLSFILGGVVTGVTEALVWTSTYGASARLGRALAD